MSGAQNASTTTVQPRVGGIEENIAWTGGSNLQLRIDTSPWDVRCFRPTEFRSMQEQEKLLKKGVSEEMKLTLVDENEKDTQTVSSWINKIKFLIKN